MHHKHRIAPAAKTKKIEDERDRAGRVPLDLLQDQEQISRHAVVDAETRLRTKAIREGMSEQYGA